MADESEGQAQEEVEVEVMEEVAGESEEEGGGLVLIIGLVLVLVIAIALFTMFVFPGCLCGSKCKPVAGLDETALGECKLSLGEKAKDFDSMDKVCSAEETCGTAKYQTDKPCCTDGKEKPAEGTPPGDAPQAGDTTPNAE